MIIIPCTYDLFNLSAAISDISTVHRVSQYLSYKRCREQFSLSVLSGNFSDTMIFKIFRDSVCSGISIDILVEYNPDRFRFFFIDFKLTIYDFISVWRKSTIPFSFTGFLHSSLHSLDTDILFFNLSNSREDGDDQFSGILGRVNAIFNAYQIDAVILHNLQCIKYIGSISSKAG